VSELGGYEKIMDAILWVSEFFKPKDNHQLTDALAKNKEAEEKKEMRRSASRSKESKIIRRNTQKMLMEANPLLSPPSVMRSRVMELDHLFEVLYYMCRNNNESDSNISLATASGRRFVLSMILEALFNQVNANFHILPRFIVNVLFFKKNRK
jgi:hypothetical protein